MLSNLATERTSDSQEEKGVGLGRARARTDSSMMPGDSGVKGLEDEVTRACSLRPDCLREYFNMLWVQRWRASKRPGPCVAVHWTNMRSWCVKCALPAGDMNLGRSRDWEAAIRIRSWQGREGTGWSLGRRSPRGHHEASQGGVRKPAEEGFSGRESPPDLQRRPEQWPLDLLW